MRFRLLINEDLDKDYTEEDYDRASEEFDRISKEYQVAKHNLAQLETKAMDSEEYQRFLELTKDKDVDRDELEKAVNAYAEVEKRYGLKGERDKVDAINAQYEKALRTVKDIKDSLRNKLTSSEHSDEDALKYAKKALKTYGRTNDLNKASYLLVTGDLLDFSDGQGYRVMDHREISDVIDMPKYSGYSDGLIRFMNMGNIRLQTSGVEISKMPNSKQFRSLRDVIYQVFNNNGEFILDLSDRDGRTVSSTVYPKNISSSRIISDIKNYFENGVKPEEPRGRFNEELSHSAVELCEKLEDIDGDFYTTDSEYDIRRLLMNKPDNYRILYDSNIDTYMICDADHMVHYQMVYGANEWGYYSDYSYSGLNMSEDEAIEYVDEGSGDLYSDDWHEDEDDRPSTDNQYLFYMIFVPTGNEAPSGFQGRKFSLEEDHYTNAYEYEFGTIFTRGDIENDVDLFKIIKQYQTGEYTLQ